MAERRSERVMGMPVVVDVRDGEPGEAIGRAFAWLRAVDATFSTYRPDSAVSRIARGELAVADAAPLVREVLARCDALRLRTRGYFDARAAGALDPSGLVKGWAVDRAAAILAGAGHRSFCIDAGGDVCVRGAPAAGRRWRVGIVHPRRHDLLAGVLTTTGVGVATSGAYERGAHIVDPWTGKPPGGVLSVTVVGPELALADAYATAAFAMGEDGPAWTATLRGYEAMTVLADATVVTTRGFGRHCDAPSLARTLGPRARASRRAAPTAPAGR